MNITVKAKITNCIIGGAIKAGTSSVFSYLSAHPQVCGSSVKETFFFTRDFTGDSEKDRKRYAKYFSVEKGQDVLLEASPNYLCFNDDTALKIRKLIPEAKLLFILREPVSRFYSHYNFAMAKLQLPAELCFSDYYELCRKYSDGKITDQQAGITVKHLRALEIGNYYSQLNNYLSVFPVEQVKVMFYDDLSKDQQGFITEICNFLDIDAAYYHDFLFQKSNVTFSGRNKFIHRIAMIANRLLETFFRRYPATKRFLIRLYKRFNQKQEGYGSMDETLQKKIAAYYDNNNKKLAQLLSSYRLPEWLR